MKRAERHHLKENELQTIAREVRERIETRSREWTYGAAAIAVVAVIAIAFFGWREYVQSRAAALLAQAIAVKEAQIGPPGSGTGGLRFVNERERLQAALTKFKAAADAYPSTSAGVHARFEEAGIWMDLGNPAQAAASYQLVIDKAGSRIYAQTARLGLAEAQAAQGQYDQAINAYKDLAQHTASSCSSDARICRPGSGPTRSRHSTAS
jgi:predicted negative regulator of RcsB-dependent stress response